MQELVKRFFEGLAVRGSSLEIASGRPRRGAGGVERGRGLGVRGDYQPKLIVRIYESFADGGDAREVGVIQGRGNIDRVWRKVPRGGRGGLSAGAVASRAG